MAKVPSSGEALVPRCANRSEARIGYGCGSDPEILQLALEVSRSVGEDEKTEKG
jgi:hypothetical protein